MVPAVVAALFGSSRLMVSGPTTPTSIVLLSSLAALAVPGSATYVYYALTLTFMVGVIQLAMGLARLGHLVDFISDSVIVGFSAGAAVLIVVSQFKDLLGVELPQGLRVHEALPAIYDRDGPHRLDDPRGGDGEPRCRHRRETPARRRAVHARCDGRGHPGGTGVQPVLLRARRAGQRLGQRAAAAVGARIQPYHVAEACAGAFAVTLFALTQTVSIARSLASRTGDLVDANQEFIGQGLSNLAGAFFSSYVSAGSFNRSAVNYEAGARTPLASVFAASLLVVILLLVAPLLSYMPKAAMAGVLFLVAVGIVDWRRIRRDHSARAAPTPRPCSSPFSPPCC